MAEGLFITFEGVDGVGKTTQVELLRGYLEQKGRHVVVTREPGGTELGTKIRELLLHGGQVAPRAEALLYAADRAHHVATKIRPALEAGDVVISDRYIDSSLAYQAGGRELTDRDVLELSEFATGKLWPRRTYVLDMSFQQSRRRLSGQPDRLESAGLEFFERTRAKFLELASRDSERFRVINASMSVEDVWAAIRTDIEGLLD